jgi:hypothetical protein
MKQLKQLLVFAIFTCICSSISAQKVGPGLSFNLDGSALGIGVHGLFSITETIDVAPSATYFFTESIAGGSSSLIILEADGHYNFAISDKLILHPLAGLSVAIASVSVPGFGSVSASSFGLNVGAGLIANRDEKLSFFGKAKYGISAGGLGLYAGVYFSL